ncbi:hypothetical protein ACQP1K_29465 (plasmid) [Sphaerimonospora sp. CA-214678]|uniref:hypothetical protein n=1 Tax=Sphaerimonospora sp. CA-214678 TaxID=3240029 RepID=UPI003D8BD4D3
MITVATYFGSRIDEIDVQVERVARLVESGQRIDRELAAGLGCSESMASIQGHIDRASASCESLIRDLRKHKSKSK